MSNERFGKERARSAGFAADVRKRRREKRSRIGDVAIHLDGKSAHGVASDNEDDEHRLPIALAEQHRVRIVRENDREILERTKSAIGRAESENLSVAEWAERLGVRDDRVTHP